MLTQIKREEGKEYVMPLYIINESSILARTIKNQRSDFDSDCEVFSTKGFLYDYKMHGNKISIQPKMESRSLIKYINSLNNIECDVIIATDDDPAGALIALEIFNLVPKAKHLTISFDSLLRKEVITNEELISLSDNKFKLELASFYLREKLQQNRIREEKEKKFAYILQHNVKSVKVPKKLFYEVFPEERN